MKLLLRGFLQGLCVISRSLLSTLAVLLPIQPVCLPGSPVNVSYLHDSLLCHPPLSLSSSHLSFHVLFAECLSVPILQQRKQLVKKLVRLA